MFAPLLQPFDPDVLVHIALASLNRNKFISLLRYSVSFISVLSLMTFEFYLMLLDFFSQPSDVFFFVSLLLTGVVDR